MRMNNEGGFALVFTLLAIVVLIVFGSIFVIRSTNEWYTADRERRGSQALYIAEGGAEAALETLDTLINTDMLNTVNGTNPSVVISDTQGYVSSGDGLGLLIQYVLDGASAPHFTLDGTEATHGVGMTALGGGAYEYDIIVTEKTNPVAVGPDQWDFPFYFRIQSAGAASGASKNILLVGDFTVRVQRDNFAKYALFTNQQTTPSGTNVWFTDKTNFAGPIHTNGRYNIALNPSGTFNGEVTQHEQTTRFYNLGSPVLMDADFNGTRDVPTFNSGFSRDEDSIALASSVQKQDMIDQATGNTAIGGSGIYVPNNGTDLIGGIYVEGNAAVSMAVNGSNQAVYTVSQGATTKIITVDEVSSQTSVEEVGVGTTTYAGLPTGIDNLGTIIYVNGNISSIGGTVQEDTALTISSENDIVITNDILYSDYTPATGTPGTVGYVPPDATGADNLLGLVTWNGDVRVGTAAPDNLSVYASILAQNGIFTVDNYWDQTVGGRGTCTLLGGVISDYYGAFGLFNGSTGVQLAGYGRDFVYDNRMKLGTSPPYFPSLNTFIAFTNDIIDKVTQQEYGS